MPGIKLFFKILIFFITTYILLHALAILGIFVAAGYLCWWFFAPRQTPCFSCMRESNNKLCAVCRSRRSSTSDALPLLSSLANELIIVILSVFSLGVVFLEASVIFKVDTYLPVAKTVTFIEPTKEEHTVGEVFPMKLDITGVEQPINAAEVDLTFDPKILQVSKIDTTDSFVTIFISRTYDNTQGQVHIVGGLPNPGFSGAKGEVANIYFQGIAPGVGTISFQPESVVLANNGKGTNVLKDLPVTQYFIKPAAVSAETSLQLEADTTHVLGVSTESASVVAPMPRFPLSVLYAVDMFTTSLWKRVLGRGE